MGMKIRGVAFLAVACVWTASADIVLSEPGIIGAYIGKGDKPGETECDLSVQLGAYRVGSGWMVLNTLRLDLGGGTPGADLLLRNMMRLKPSPVRQDGAQFAENSSF